MCSSHSMINDTCVLSSSEIGLGLTGFGVFFSFLGIVFFFDKGLIAMGNILFLSGLGLTIGLKSTMQFFTKPKNYKWILANSSSFPAKDPYPWLDFSTAICHIVP